MMDDRRILEHYPVPLARGFRRYRNAKEARERHDAAYYLFEIYLKYVSSVAIAYYLAGEARDHRVNAALKGLARPSLGEWLRFLRESLSFLGQQENPDAVIQAISALLDRKESRWEGIVQLYNGLRAFRCGTPSSRERMSLGMLLDEIVSYRNRVLGHGAPLGREHYESFAGLLGSAFPDLLRESPFLTACRMVTFDAPRVHEGSRVDCGINEFMGLQPVAKERPLSLPYGSPPPREGCLYLLSQDESFVALDPLLIAHREDVYFLNDAEGTPEYLSYTTGDHYRPTGLGEAQEGLFARILGYRVDESRMSRIGGDVVPDAVVPAEGPPEGEERRLGDYRILREIGRGAMGAVFEAVQESLGRRVALKVLPGSFALDPRRVERFRREARATARIHHPAIVPVYEVGEAEGTHYYAMEFIDGRSLGEMLTQAGETARETDRNPFTDDPERFARTVEQVAFVAEGLEEAHRMGLIHRDVKPSNILVDSSGRHVLVDFGLVREEEAQTLTRSGEMIGTLHYMSPEQVSRRRVDLRTDVYSLGITLYEILTLRPPFQGPSEHEIQNAILFKEPVPPRRLNPRLGRDVETIVLHALEKDPDRRYASAAELVADLRRFLRREPIRARPPSTLAKLSRRASRHKLPVALVMGIVVVVLAAAAIIWRIETNRWAQEQIPEISRLADEERYYDAYCLAEEVESYLPDDPKLTELWPRITREYSVSTTPPGAEIYCREYTAADAPWRRLGRSPLEKIRFPRGLFRWRILKEGFEPTVCAGGQDRGYAAWDKDSRLDVKLIEEGALPPGMVAMEAGELTLRVAHLPRESVEAPPFFMDIHEVSNEAFKEFVDEGGYQNRDYWEHPFVKDGKNLSWEEAMTRFHDATGMPGPRTWAKGTYPEGEGRYPVSGVSWYEAAAYAEFKGKSLPTIYHWSEGASIHDAWILVPLSNIEGKGPAPAGAYSGMSRRGLYDMAGNVREWCWNATDESGERRPLLGGSWADPTYMFNSPEALSPWDRSRLNGFRCVTYIGGVESLPEKLLRPVKRSPYVDYRSLTPWTDEEFQRSKKEHYEYDRTDLEIRTENIDETPEHWRREKVSFRTAYGNERMTAFLYLPRGVREPYQGIVLFPSLGAFSTRKSFEEADEAELPAFLIRSGRALLFPIYDGSYDRKSTYQRFPWGRIQSIYFRDFVIRLAMDFGRSTDYLETRDDIDPERIAYYGGSFGALMGPILMALEDERVRLGVLMTGGLWASRLLEAADPFNFAPHVKQPVLMVNGTNDLLFPLKESQEPLYDLLGTKEEDKKHFLIPGGHFNEPLLDEARTEVCDWLDKYLGPVEWVSP